MVAVAHAPLRVLPDVQMSQSAVLIGALIAMFILYLAMNNRLVVYWALLTGGSGASVPAGPVATPAPGGTGAGVAGTTSSPTATPRLYIPSNPNVPPS